MKTLVINYLVVWLLFVTVVHAEDCFVSGKTVDKNNNPVKDASIVAYTPPSGWEDLIVIYKSDESGYFSIDIPCKSVNTHLFVTPALDVQNYFIPISPPFWIKDKMYKNISARKLPGVKRGNLNVGKIIVPEYYKIEVSFEDEKGNPFLPEKLDSDFWLKIKTIDGNWVKSGSISSRDDENAKSPDKSSLKMILPEGKWIIEIGFNEDKNPFFYPDKIIDLSNIQINDNQKVTLKMSKNKVSLKN